MNAAALARSALSGLARDGRDLAALDADRRQGPARADALAEPRLAGAALRDGARARHLADPGRRRDPRDRVRLHRPPPRRAHQPRRGARRFALEPQTGRRLLSRASWTSLRGLGVAVAINEMPNEVPEPDPLLARTASTPPTTPPRRIASGARSSRPIASSSCSAPAFSARRARCISSGAASTSR